MLQTRSLASRIFIASLLLAPPLLGFSAYMLDSAFHDSLFNAERESLLAHTYAMMGAAEPSDGTISLSQSLSDPRFTTPASGLYAAIVDQQQKAVWQSNSLIVSSLPGLIPYKAVTLGDAVVTSTLIEGVHYFISRFNTVWEIDDVDQEFQFVTIHSQEQLNKAITQFRNTLLTWLGIFILLLVIVQTAIIRWGLLPLKRLAIDIKALEAGSASSLDDTYPEEIIPVTENINMLLESEKTHQKRYKNTLADLAHSLKTPLSVIRSLLEKNDHSDDGGYKRNAIDEQVERMSNIVTHQLNRASAKSKPSFQSALALQPLFERLALALNKVYKDKTMAFQNALDISTIYRAEEGDMLEVFGNILENAFKYGSSAVRVSCVTNGDALCIVVEDDGPGIAAHQRKQILARGARIDSAQPGQGIGLSVAADIISTYGGGIAMDSSSLGGASFSVTLPHD
ncbi:MAG: two-component system sensor histidine kinase PhoQ [Lentisphaeria bacterium]|jgi:two-component system sensor histidine kinase PhoQ